MLALQKPRQTNIELLRVIAMFMVVVLHCNAFGKNMQQTDLLTLNWFGVYFLEFLSIVAVNCYVLISGYFLITSEFRWRKLFTIWLQILFYSISFYCIIGPIYGWGSMFTLIYSVFPVASKSYWFATTYIVLYILSPFLNVAIRSMSKSQLQCCILVLLTTFSLWSSIFSFVTTLDPTNGYGIIWFVTLYFVAAYMRIYQPYKNVRKKYYLLVYILIVFLAILCLVIAQKISFPWILAFQRYNGLGTFVASLSLFAYFLLVDFSYTKFNTSVVKLSSLTFGVYLIHENFLVREHLYTDILNMPLYVNTPIQVPYIIVCALCIYIIASLIEYFRQKIFAILRVDVFAQNLDIWITKKIVKLKTYLE